MRQAWRIAIGTAILLLPLSLGPGPIGPNRAVASSGAPNVLLIITDDQRATETMQVMDDTRSWFEGQGTRFTDAYATTPLCCPSRSSIFSGRYAHNTGVRTNSSGFVLDHHYTLQRYLHDAGYRTAIFGKFLNQWAPSRRPPNFDDWAIFAGGYYDNEFNVHGQMKTITRNSSLYIASRAEGFLDGAEKDDSRPWFMVLSTSAPHLDPEPEPKYEHTPVGTWPGNPAVSETDASDKPPLVQDYWSKTLPDGRSVRAAQLRTLLTVDDMVSRVTTSLAEKDEDRDTLAIFMSDNGMLWEEHGIQGKTWPYLPSVKIPLIVRWPGHVAEAVKDDRMAANIDIAPTVMEAAGLAPDPTFPMDGRSLFGSDLRDHLLIEFWETPDSRTPSWAGLLTPKYEFVRYYTSDLAEVTFQEYYDLSADRWELDNLLGDKATWNDPDVGPLVEQLDQDRACAGGTCP